MFVVSQKEFENIVADAIDNIPPGYGERIKNLAFIVEDDPSLEQRQKLKLNSYQTLFGLYEGTPLTNRGNYNLALPDKITLFKNPIEMSVNSHPELVEQVRQTLWHEVAHYYGLGHGRIHELENK